MLPHEKLEVYRAGLDMVRWMAALPGATVLPTRSHRQIDEGVTSVLLNIAEGNGRYSEVDHRHFLDLAAAQGPGDSHSFGPGER